jgi:hypothetical protein
MLYLNTVSAELVKLARAVMALPEISPFRMVGGTALALQIGHRNSVDIDLFSNEKVSKNLLAVALEKAFPNNVFDVTSYNLVATIQGVKLEIFDDWHSPFRHEPIVQDGLRLASIKDIASFKLDAIIERREKKDYIDLYFLFNILGAANVLEEYKQSNPFVSVKSILFALAEVSAARDNKSVMPNLVSEVNWQDVETLMLEAARNYFPKR